MYKKKPYFIVFEGLEGCGKSFSLKKIVFKFNQKPGLLFLQENQEESKSQELIRKLILDDYFNEDNKNKFDK